MCKKRVITGIAVCIIGITSTMLLAEGYSNTPMLPGGKWHVHDPSRPAPKIVTPPSSTLKAPSDAIVLFDGTDFSKWTQIKEIKIKGKPIKLITRSPRWKIENGYAEVVKNTGNIFTKEPFGSCQLHVEWMSPPPKKGKHGQKCGNSGIFFMKQYEVQVLNSFENRTYSDGQAAAIYGQYPPLVNACRKPGEWQTYDIIFDAPKFKDGKLLSPAYITVIHNGVLVQNHTEVLGPTRHKKGTKYTPHADKMPLRLQDHGDPVRYRNIWIRPL